MPKKKDTDPHGISASMDLVKKLSEIKMVHPYIHGCQFAGMLHKINKKAIRIRKKFRKGEEE